MLIEGRFLRLLISSLQRLLRGLIYRYFDARVILSPLSCWFPFARTMRSQAMHARFFLGSELDTQRTKLFVLLSLEIFVWIFHRGAERVCNFFTLRKGTTSQKEFKIKVLRIMVIPLFGQLLLDGTNSLIRNKETINRLIHPGFMKLLSARVANRLLRGWYAATPFCSSDVSSAVFGHHSARLCA